MARRDAREENRQRDRQRKQQRSSVTDGRGRIGEWGAASGEVSVSEAYGESCVECGNIRWTAGSRAIRLAFLPAGLSDGEPPFGQTAEVDEGSTDRPESVTVPAGRRDYVTGH